MAKSASTNLQHVPPEVTHVIEQLERHCLAPDASLLSKSAYDDLQQAKEEMLKERRNYLEAMAVYCEAIAMVEEYQQTASASAGLGSGFSSLKDITGLYPNLKLNCSNQVYESLEHHLAVAEATQRLRLPLLSKSGEVQTQEDDAEKLSSRSSFDSTTPTSISPGSTTNFYSNTTLSVTSASGSISAGNSYNNVASDVAADPPIGGVADRFLGITPAYLYQSQQDKPILSVDMADYQRPLVREIEARLETKCDMLAEIFSSEEIDSSSINPISSARLPERVKMIIEEIEKEEADLLDDLSSMDRKFNEHYNVLEQILSVLIKFVKKLKLQHQHEYDEMKKTWLCKRCQTMNAKLRVLEHLLLRDTYTKDSVPALHRIRKYLLEATEEASMSYNKAVTRLREYQGVDPHFDSIARQYHDIVKKLEGMRWTIDQVEMDLKQRSLDHQS
ncbi:HAUS augmin-like complex subunit 4 [Rhynchospora pubera]|uniref:HAUS augmin-like complex subunit 4 n=1 Tax=Rhynchospora pubera TaxID=906938 RepID=A0AAV8FBY6_9POAL|nr:HAUS augmin-like complex subunit 4 [Rhynchospora pubera]